MRRGVLGSSVLVGSGAVLLLWAVLASREDPRQKAPPPASRPLRAEPALSDREASAPVPPPARSLSSKSVEAGNDDYGILRERIRQMEERLANLDVRRNDLAAANLDLERQIREKSAEASARMMADWRVRSLEALLGLSGVQKQALVELWTMWGKEDGGRSADHATWLSRELDVRARLTAEQAAVLHDNAANQVRQGWSFMGTTLGSMIGGVSRDEQVRFQQTLGEFPVQNAMLLPEAYGADWGSMMKQASSLVQPLLTADQRAKLDRFVQR